MRHGTFKDGSEAANAFFGDLSDVEVEEMALRVGFVLANLS